MGSKTTCIRLSPSELVALIFSEKGCLLQRCMIWIQLRPSIEMYLIPSQITTDLVEAIGLIVAKRSSLYECRCGSAMGLISTPVTASNSTSRELTVP